MAACACTHPPIACIKAAVAAAYCPTPEGYRFRFLGGTPGWASRGEQATIETVVLVSPDAKTSRVEYNGPVRSVVYP